MHVRSEPKSYRSAVLLLIVLEFTECLVDDDLCSFFKNSLSKEAHQVFRGYIPCQILD